MVQTKGQIYLFLPFLALVASAQPEGSARLTLSGSSLSLAPGVALPFLWALLQLSPIHSANID